MWMIRPLRVAVFFIICLSALLLVRLYVYLHACLSVKFVCLTACSLVYTPVPVRVFVSLYLGFIYLH